MIRADVAIIGGGILGLATAYRLGERFPRYRIVVVEKEEGLAHHQTGRNSGVLHSGIYYRPGSLKAVNCRKGKLAMEQFCEREGIPYELCGKVIVAVDESEIPALRRIHERGQANGVRSSLIDRQRLLELEPHAAGVAAIHVPDAGIVDFRRVAERLAARIREAGGEIRTGTRVVAFRASGGGRRLLECSSGAVEGDVECEVECDVVVNCGGLHSDRLTRLSGQRPAAKIVPFRGEYYRLRPVAHRLCRHLIYPVPDPSFPFLGVHFTRMIDGEVECGPNAVLAFAREGYRKFDIDLRDLVESLTFPGFLRLAARHWKTGLGEMWRSISKAAFVRALQRLVPEIQSEHLEPAPAGVRAQALTRNGALVDDFLICEGEGVIHVLNAPSPAATSSLNIAALIVDKLAEKLEN